MRFIGETYRLRFEKNPLPMWVDDSKSLHFLAVNDAAVAHCGYPRNEYLRMTVEDILPPEDVPALMKEVDASEGTTETIGIGRHLTRDGGLIDAEVLGNEIGFDDHRAAGDHGDRLAALDTPSGGTAAELTTGTMVLSSHRISRVRGMPGDHEADEPADPTP